MHFLVGPVGSAQHPSGLGTGSSSDQLCSGEPCTFGGGKLATLRQTQTTENASTPQQLADLRAMSPDHFVSLVQSCIDSHGIDSIVTKIEMETLDDKIVMHLDATRAHQVVCVSGFSGSLAERLGIKPGLFRTSCSSGVKHAPATVTWKDHLFVP